MWVFRIILSINFLFCYLRDYRFLLNIMEKIIERYEKVEIYLKDVMDILVWF